MAQASDPLMPSKDGYQDPTARSPSPIESTSEAFEDARSEPDDTFRREVLLGREDFLRRRSFSTDRLESDFSDLELPPLEPFADFPFQGECASLNADSIELENDILPSTPLTDEQLGVAEELGVPINQINDEYWGLRHLVNAAEQAEEFAIAIWHKLQSWKVIHFSHLPQWLQDNDFLHFGHRPPLPTSECFKSIIRIHTETGNIWTHLLGVVAFSGLAAFFLSRPSTEIEVKEKLVFSCFFAGAIVCLGLSFLYHTLCCNKSKEVGRLFAKFDYCGIAFLTVGSFVPWLYYSFYCDWKPQVIYLSIVVALGIGAVVVSTFDFFAGPKFRPLRAGVFIFFGLSGIAPATHYGIVNGWEKSLEEVAIGWLILMGSLYITGALFYAMRIPERFFPGKLDIWFHSHQIFHCFVIAGAFVHYHGISLMALYRLKMLSCLLLGLLTRPLQALPVGTTTNIDIPLVVGDLDYDGFVSQKVVETTPGTSTVIINHPHKARQPIKTIRPEKKFEKILARNEQKNQIPVQGQSQGHSFERFEVRPTQNHEVRPTQNHEVRQTQNHEVRQVQNHEVGQTQNHDVRQVQNHEVGQTQNHDVRHVQNHEVRQTENHGVKPTQNHEVRPNQNLEDKSEDQIQTDQSKIVSSIVEEPLRNERDAQSSQGQKVRYSSPPQTSKSSYSSKEEKIPIIRNSKSVSQKEDRAYKFDFESGNGIQREEQGFLKNPSSKNPAQVMSGSWSYTGPDGKIYTITYVADENGFRAEGDHLPQAPSG